MGKGVVWLLHCQDFLTLSPCLTKMRNAPVGAVTDALHTAYASHAVRNPPPRVLKGPEMAG
jgi:hypothetical protein